GITTMRVLYTRQSNPVRGGQTQGCALVLSRLARRARLGPELADRLAEEGPARSKIGFGAAHSTLNHRLISERRLHSPRRLSAGQLGKRDEAGTGPPSGPGGSARAEQQGPGYLIERSSIQQRSAGLEHRALGGHEDVVYGEMVSPCAAHTPDMPGVEQFGLGRRHEQVELFRLAVLEPGLAVLKDLGASREPCGVSAARAESLPARNAVPAWYHDCLSCGKRRVRGAAAGRIDPDQASDVTRHPRRVGREDRALIDDPAGAGVGFPDLLEHLNIGRQIDLRAAQGTGKR